MTATAPVYFRWLGAAGVEFEVNGCRLLIDPFLTRFPLWKLLSRVEPDAKIIREFIRPCQAILVTHAHWDHLADVAAIASLYGALVYGSENTCQILKQQGLPDKQLRKVDYDSQFTLPGIEGRLLPGQHMRTPLDLWINAPLSHRIKSPLRPIDYHKDSVFAIHLKIGNLTLMHGEGEARADVLFVSPFYSGQFIDHTLPLINPRLIIPIHWDDFMRSLRKPILPSLGPLRKSFPWLRRVDLAGYVNKIEAQAPDAQVVIPKLFTTYQINDMIDIS
jgi:L-ascorbate metabolism protein UlaG (beta-lactamase superfamily)